MHCTTSIFECHIVLIENYSGQPDCCKAPANYRMKFKGIRFSRALLTSKPPRFEVEISSWSLPLHVLL